MAVLTFIPTQAQQSLPEPLATTLRKAVKTSAKVKKALATLTSPPTPSSDTAPLPKPSLTEPFSIGEGFYVESRLPDAVVSMLSLMRIRVVPDARADAPAAPDANAIVLSEAEVRALIDLGMQDLEASPDMESLPHSFADLHAAVADLLPGVSVEQLAESYTRAYEARPDDLVAKALMGQPIEPETRLTRTQIWFLLMDGFAGAAANGARWGTADSQLPDLPSPNPQWNAEWREVLARLPLIAATRLVTIDAPSPVAYAAAANATPLNVTARMSVSVPPLVSRLTGRQLIAARTGSLSGQNLAWHVSPESVRPQQGRRM